MSKKHDADLATFNLDDLGFDDDDDVSDEEITSITAQAILKDQKDDNEDDSRTYLALLRYMRAKDRTLRKRVGRLEKLVVMVTGGAIALTAAWEFFKAVYLPHG